MKLNLKDTFQKSLPADPILENTRRQVKNACYSFVEPKKTANPKILHVSEEMAEEIGLSPSDLKGEYFRDIFTGNAILPDTKPFAMCYGGHQFGHWAGQLGDGRAINLTEVNHNGNLWAIQLKGAGETPYSRSADGLAVLRSSVREYLCSEAMHHLGVPTTRALSLALSGDEVMRDPLYDGNPALEKGAIVTRVSPSFLRFGSFEIFAAQKDIATLKRLLDYTIENFYSHLGKPSQHTYLAFLKEVVEQHVDLVVHWQRVGFVHGVLNTDNMSILGLTIDYGPYGWLEGYDKGWTPNTTDKVNKRYRFGNQPSVVQWNLYQLANAIYPLIEDAPPMEAILKGFQAHYNAKYLNMMTSKIGLFSFEDGDEILIQDLEETLQLTETDMTIFFRNLGSFNQAYPDKGLGVVADAFYIPNEVSDSVAARWKEWFLRYATRLKKESISHSERKQKMDAVNPKYILRNYMAQLAIDAANKGDYTLIDELFQLLTKPYEEQETMEKWFAKRPVWARHKVGCSMLSCSS